MNSLQPKDLVALVTMVGILILKFKGFDGKLDAAAALILGYYFAHRQNGSDKGI